MPFSLIAKMAGLLIIIYVIGNKLQELWTTETNVIPLLAAICILVGIYFIGLIVLQIVSKEEWDQLKKRSRR
ncbi:hypothetical protein [Piscibacillus salipiscarius]|nr:hypothetical protein [Piscibacillus salipiscarius]